MSDANAIWEFSEELERKAKLRSNLAERIKRLAQIKKGTVIIIGNFLSPNGLRKSGAYDNTFIGNYKDVILKELEFGGTSDTEPSGNDIGVAVEFKEKSKILTFGGREYDLPDRLKDKAFYEKATPRFVDNPEMRGNLHYNSCLIIVRNDEEDRNFANQYLKCGYKSSLDEAGF